MTAFYPSSFLTNFGVTSLIESDNAPGHGNRSAEEAMVKREQSRIQSQLYMCRKPRRTTDGEGISSSTSSIPTNQFLSPRPASVVRNSITIRHNSPNSVTDMRFFPSLDEPKQTLCSSYSKSTQTNAPNKPLRKASFDSSQENSITIINAGMASLHKSARVDRQSLAGLARVLSTLDL